MNRGHIPSDAMNFLRKSYVKILAFCCLAHPRFECRFSSARQGRSTFAGPRFSNAWRRPFEPDADHADVGSRETKRSFPFSIRRACPPHGFLIR